MDNKLEQIQIIISEIGKLDPLQCYNNKVRCYDIIEMIMLDKIKIKLTKDSVKYLLERNETN